MKKYIALFYALSGEKLKINTTINNKSSFSVHCQEPDLRIMKTFGHTGISLGGLYSAIEDRFMPAMGLWSAEDIEKNKQTIHHPKADTFWTTRQTKDEKIDTLSIEITGSVGLNLPVVPSPIKATASLKYIQKTDVCIIF